ncbi:uncharacterized protein KD926_008929 [Aspergillus affinis]|uniref:uncharacterized protein n=1 Tax=Aspergillus affinis TaxID=1070780 RepID=UPI0022FF19C1|nr:uncharacterized protein KD926_008929 [Aspergillus affinis]KAI9039943.1 hypothetical protein KD926_008929 [Aspergillus affinis]
MVSSRRVRHDQGRVTRRTSSTHPAIEPSESVKPAASCEQNSSLLTPDRRISSKRDGSQNDTSACLSRKGGARSLILTSTGLLGEDTGPVRDDEDGNDEIPLRGSVGGFGPRRKIT